MPKTPPRDETELAWRRMFGGRIRRVREEELKLNQQEMAARLGRNTGAWVSDIERGINGMDVYPFWRLCSVSNYPPDFFLDSQFNSRNVRTPATRVDWERLFPEEPARAAAHFELDQVFRRHLS